MLFYTMTPLYYQSSILYCIIQLELQAFYYAIDVTGINYRIFTNHDNYYYNFIILINVDTTFNWAINFITKLTSLFVFEASSSSECRIKVFLSN